MLEPERQTDDLPGGDFVRARAMCGILRDFIMNREGGHQDELAIHTIRDLSGKALAGTSDPVLRSAFARIEQLALALFSERDHELWDRVGLSGRTRLKQLLMRELIRVRSHLSKLEASSVFFLNRETPASTDRVSGA